MEKFTEKQHKLMCQKYKYLRQIEDLHRPKLLFDGIDDSIQEKPTTRKTTKSTKKQAKITTIPELIFE